MGGLVYAINYTIPPQINNRDIEVMFEFSKDAIMTATSRSNAELKKKYNENIFAPPTTDEMIWAELERIYIDNGED